MPLLLRNDAAVEDRETLKLLQFVQERCRHPEKLVLAHVVPGTDPVPAQGWSWRRDPEDPSRSRIQVSVTPGELPAWLLYRRAAGIVHMRDWRDEVIYTAAHELRHVDQFIDGVPRYYEVDAERFAMSVLLEFRMAEDATVHPHHVFRRPPFADGFAIQQARAA